MSGSRAVGFAALSLLAAALVLPVDATPAAADTGTSYVDIRDASCSDTGAGTQAQPYCTLQAAADAAQPGETVQLASGGTYPATTVTSSGAAGQPLTISGGGGYVFIPRLTFSGVHDVALEGIQLAGSAGGVEVQDSADVTLDALRVDAPHGTRGRRDLRREQ